MQMIKFDTRLKPETIEQIKKQDEIQSRSVSGMARKILEDYFNRNCFTATITGGPEIIEDMAFKIDDKPKNTSMKEIVDFVVKEAKKEL